MHTISGALVLKIINDIDLFKDYVHFYHLMSTNNIDNYLRIKILYIFHFLSCFSQLIIVYLKPKNLHDKHHNMMFTHHILTLLLLIISYAFNYTIIGIYILYLHEISDIFLDLTKIFKYLYRFNLAKFFMTLLIIIWFYLRIYNFGDFIIEAKYFLYYNNLDIIKQNTSYIAIFFIDILFIFDIIWFIFIVKLYSKIILKNPKQLLLILNKEYEQS